MRVGNLNSSLSGRIFLAFIAPATIVLIALSLGHNISAGTALSIVDDKMLLVISRTMTRHISESNNSASLDVPSQVLQDLEGGERDRVHYAIQLGDRLAPGSKTMRLKKGPARQVGEAKFYDGDIEGTRVRILELPVRLENSQDVATLYLAAEPDSKGVAQWGMAKTFIFNGAVLLLCLVVIIPFSVAWAIRPLTGLKGEIETRLPSENRPLPTEATPRELRSIVEAFNALLQRSHELLSTSRRFTADASHQMRTPLSILRTHLDVIRREGIEDPKGQSSLKDMEDAADRLQRLVTQLLALARVEDPSRIEDLFEQTDLVAVAREVAEFHLPAALAAGIDLHFDAEPDQVFVPTVDMLAHEMIANLLDNAIRYTPAGSTVCLSLSERESSVSIVIEDDGPGIPPEETDRMFDRFTRLRRDRDHLGSGLGLAIVKALAKAIHVSVTLSARQQGTGVRAEMLFPRRV